MIICLVLTHSAWRGTIIPWSISPNIVGGVRLSLVLTGEVIWSWCSKVLWCFAPMI